MKKLILWFFLVTLLSDLAPGAKAQTKEATVLWLSQTIESYRWRIEDNLACHFVNDPSSRYLRNVFSSLNAGNSLLWITIRENFPQDNDPQWRWQKRSANLADLTNVEICSDCDYCDEVPLLLHFKSGSVSVANDDAKGDKSVDVSDRMWLYINWSGEPDLRNRMVKAFMHLIELNGNKETF